MRNDGLALLFLSIFILSGCHPNPYRQGKDLYEFHCAGCHGSDGSGLAKLIPALDTAKLKLNEPEKLVCLILNGLPFDSLTRQQMPSNKALNEVEMTNLINYLGVEYIQSPRVLRVEETQQMYSSCQSTKAPE